MSFQKLFKEADDASGISVPFPYEQADTSAFDVDEEDDEQEAKPSRVTFADREVDKLQGFIKRVLIRPDGRNKSTGRPLVRPSIIKKEENNGKPSSLNILPEISWEQEIERTMCNESSSEEESKAETVKGDNGSFDSPNSLYKEMSLVRRTTTSYDGVVRSFTCLDDPNFYEEDPLDVLIMNPEKGSYMSMLPLTNTKNINNYDHSSEEEDDDGVGASEMKSPSTGRTKTSAIVPASEADNSAVEPMDMSFMSKAERDKQRKLEKALRIKGVDINFDAAASIERSANMRPRDHLPQHRNRSNRSLIAALNHCTIATSHKNAKPDLYEVELKYFHRPRMIRERDRIWSVIPKSVYRKTPSGGSHKFGTTGGGSASSAVSKAAAADADKQNLSLANTHAEFILLEYVEEFPPVMLNYGMASAMFNYFRAPEQNEEEDVTKAQAQSESNKLVESVLSDRNRSRLPRHLMLLLQLRNVKQAYDHDVSVPRLKQGETKVLNGEDDSPFLGKIEEGEIQQSFTNNLFRAPIFKHTPHPTDFILIRTKNTATSMTYMMREIPHLYLCGQVEPQKIVPRPVPMITVLQEKFYLLAAVRFLHAHFDGADFEDMQRSILKYCLKAKSSPHKGQHRMKLKAILRKVGDEVKESSISGAKWYLRDFSERAIDADDAADLERRFSPEELSRSFTPEDVCLQESCNAAEYRFFQQHITDVDLSKIEMWLTHTENVKQLQMDRAEKAMRLAGDCKAANPDLSSAIERFIFVLIQQIRRTEAKLAVGRFIFDRLAAAPWNTTEAYVRSHLERDGQGRLDLKGAGDPSGCGDGFSFVRIVKSARASGPANKKNSVQFYKTDKDLRKLTKKDAVQLLVALGVREAEAMALKRWDRVHMIREISTKLEKTGTGLAKELYKYARSGAEIAPGTTSESFQATAQEIWNRQKKALTITNAPTTTATTADTGAGGSAGAGAGGGTGGHHRGTPEPVKSDGEDSGGESDEDFTEKMTRILAARAAASATLEQRAKLSKQVEEEKKELKNMSSFFSALNKPNTSAAGGSSSSSSHVLSSKGGEGVSAAVIEGGDGAGVVKKRKVQIGISGLAQPADDVGSSGMHQSLTIPITALPSASSSSEQPLPDDWVRPRRVVKRIIRSVLSDGSESYRIEFIFDSSEVSRVERTSIRLKQEREFRRSASAAGGYAGIHGKEEEEEENDNAIPTAVASMKINLSRMKQVVDQNNLVLKRDRGEFDGDDAYYNAYPGAGGGGGKSSHKSSKRSAEIVINTRVPRASLAARLEEELMKLWNSKFSIDFRYPVNPVSVPGYYQRISEPISLSDIRDKIVSYHYETAAAMQEDVDKMAQNAETFNGAGHRITTAAKKLASMLQINLRHDREHLGAEHDQISFMEEAIRRKKVYLRKSQQDPAASNPLIPNLKQ